MIPSWDILTTADDALLTRSVVAILDSSGEALLGTGTFISVDGDILTAHHVVSSFRTVVVRTHGGKSLTVPVTTNDLHADSDLAILSSGLDECDALPIALIDGYVPSTFRTRGFQFKERGFDDAIPIEGRVGGRTHVVYDEYRIDNALTLPDSLIDKGTSGAPLFDPHTRAVIGIVVSGIKDGPNLATAVPLTKQTIASWERFSKAYEKSNDCVPRFGSLINDLGVRAICDLQRNAMVGFLERADLFKREKIIHRENFSVALSGFELSNKRVLPVLGRSGVGKTSVLALRADDDRGSLLPCLLLRGVDILSGDEGVKGLADRTLAKLADELALQIRPRVTDLTKVGPLLILLDGLNESSANARELIDSWLPQTASWLSLSAAKLVVSCRPEFWQLIKSAILPDYIYSLQTTAGDDNLEAKDNSPSKPEQLGVRLGDFTAPEADRALHAYGLQGLLRPGETLHPFTLALAQEVGIETATAASNLFSVLDLYVGRKIERALMRSGSPTWLSAVSSMVEKSAGIMLARGIQRIDRAELTQLFGEYATLVDLLAEEHLWLNEESGFHFQFDQVREFLQARRIDPMPILKSLVAIPWPALDETKRYGPRAKATHFFKVIRALLSHILVAARCDLTVPPSVLSFSILGLAHSSAWDQVGKALDLLKEATLETPPTEPSRYAHEIAILLAFRLNNPGASSYKLVEWVRAAIEYEVRLGLSARDGAAIEQLTNLVANFNISIAEKLSLAKRIFLTENGGEWTSAFLASHAWNSRYARYLGLIVSPTSAVPDSEPESPPETLSSAKRRPVSYLLEKLAQADSRLVLDTLIGWLDDETKIGTRLAGNSLDACIGDCAATCLYYLREYDCDWLCEQLISPACLRFQTQAHFNVLVKAIATIETDALLKICLTRLVVCEASEAAPIAKVLWLCSGHARDPTLKHGIAHLLPVLLDIERVDSGRIWIARSIFEIYLWYRWYLERNSSTESLAARTYQALRPSLPAARQILAKTLSSDVAIAEDFSYLLSHNFERTIEDIERLACSASDIQSKLINGVSDLLRASTLKQSPSRIDDFKRLVAMMSSAFDRAKPHVKALIAEKVATHLSNAGSSHVEIYFGVETVYALGLVELGKRIASEDGQNSGEAFVSLARSPVCEVRHEFIDLICRPTFNEKTFAEFIGALASNVVLWEISFAELRSYRAQGRYREWDHAVLRYLGLGVTRDDEYHKFCAECCNVWQGLAPDEHSDLSREFLSYIGLGISPGQAARMCGWLSEMGKKDILSRLSRR